MTATAPLANSLPTFFDISRYVPVAEAASMLGMDHSALCRKCRDELAADALAIKAIPPEGGQEQWFVLKDWNPRLIGGTIGQLYADPDLSAFTLKQQRGAMNRRVCVEEFRQVRCQTAVKMGVLIPGLVAKLQQRFPELPISYDQLCAWDRTYRRPADLVLLVDRRGGDRRSQGSLESWKTFTDLFLHENAPTIKQCWQETWRIAAASGWKWCSLKSCHAQLNKRIDPETQVLHRDPEAFRTAMQPTIEQQVEAWAAGQCWVGDHKQLDLWCMYGEKLVRPWLTAWMDWRTRRLVGWVLSDAPNSSTILAALRHGLKDESNMGGPEVVQIDNGKDYDAWVFHGQTKRERLGKIDAKVDESGAGGIFHRMGITPHFAIPYNANGKARLERWFRTLDPFFKTFETYAGNSVETRPQRLNEVLSRPGLIPPFKDVYERIAAYIEGYNQRNEHEIPDLVEGAERLSPDAAMALWCTTRRVWADPGAVDLLVQMWKKPTTVGRNGIAISLMGETFRYGQFEPALRPFKGLHKKDRKPVLVSYDPHDVRQIKVYDAHFRFVCVAKMNDQGGLHAGDAISQAKVADLNRQKAQYTKAKKHVAEYGITSVLTNEEQLAAMTSNKPKPQAEPSSLKIVRTPLDGQAKAIEQQQLRKAVGAEHQQQHMGLEIFEQLRQRRQQAVARRDDDFSADPWAQVRSVDHG